MGDTTRRYDTALVWFRRDLRSDDHAALYFALSQARKVYCAFVFDTEILDPLADREDRRVDFIWRSIGELSHALDEMGGGLHVEHGRARDVIPALAGKFDAQAVYANHDYEPLANDRDAHVREQLARQGCLLHTFKDQVIFEKDEVLTQGGRPFTVFTPYRRAWLAKLNAFYCKAYPVDAHKASFARTRAVPMPSLEKLGFKPAALDRLQMPTGMTGARGLLNDFLRRIEAYEETRNYPSLRGVSYLSVHLRFGTISIRELVRAVVSLDGAGAKAWLSELIWREFYFGILHHFPHVVRQAFKPEYEALRFSNSPAWFAAWCEGRTGFPLVDAAMRQLNETGYLHNRLRMVAASFLVKDLHVDWRWGESYFARKLNDFDLAANNGGWQWAASTGCDAQPWFRIFNPVTQSRNFDADGRFIRLYVHELANVDSSLIHEPWKMTADEQRAAGVRVGRDYPAPIVDHAAARVKTLEIYEAVRRH